MSLDEENDDSWLSSYTTDFRKRLINLLSYEFRTLPCSLALQFIDPKIKASSGEE
jgi:N-acetyltransferase 10